MITMQMLFKGMMDKRASDLHVRVGVPPVLRIDGTLFKANMEAISNDLMSQFLQEIMTSEQRASFEITHEIDFGYGMKGVGRFRINAFRQRGSVSMAIRAISTEIPKFEELHLPEVILDIAMKKRGLILVTGTTGSGKSTLLSAMVDHININASRNIITIEDPIEFLHHDKKSIIVQREIGADTHDFPSALRSCFRQDPDIILIGEIRDAITMEIALSASDTGHLVMSTLHTMNAVETVSRVISFFPPHQHDQIRLVLAHTLVAIVSLRLLPRKDGVGRVPAAEVLINNAAMAEYIRDPHKVDMIPGAVAEGFTQYGSQTFDQSLLTLYKEELITLQIAKQYANNPDDFELKVKGVEGTSDRSWMT